MTENLKTLLAKEIDKDLLESIAGSEDHDSDLVICGLTQLIRNSSQLHGMANTMAVFDNRLRG